VRIKFDENMPGRAVKMAEGRGHDVRTVVSQDLGGAEDEVIAQVVMSENRVLCTLDTDFGDIRAYPPENFEGVIVLRPKNQDAATVTDLLERALSVIEDEYVVGKLWIVEPERIRKR
jgi:predicted nuclease of predicted toxin-antitoxin system